jgi:hypothetical protein
LSENNRRTRIECNQEEEKGKKKNQMKSNEKENQIGIYQRKKEEMKNGKK